MAFTPTKETYSGKVYSVTIGTGDKAVTFGGENVLPFNSFEGSAPNRPGDRDGNPGRSPD